MGNINLYKIDQNKVRSFFQKLDEKIGLKKEIELSSVNETGIEERFKLGLYLANTKEDRNVNWNWVLQEFGESPITITAAPRGVITINKECGNLYAVTFGYAYFTVDKYCDRDFGFSFARKLRFQEIKTTASTIPNSLRNKIINSYTNYGLLDFDSGESFVKLKVKIDLDNDFELFKPGVEIGSSIKISVERESLENILATIQYIEYVLENEDDKQKIPVFSKVKDEALIAKLEKKLEEVLTDNPAYVNLSELEIVGATEIFNHNDQEYLLRFKDKSEHISNLSFDILEEFCTKYRFDFKHDLLNISVVIYRDGNSVDTKKIKELIDYTDDDEKCLLSQGNWYQYNDDYISYLETSVSEIDVVYNPAYDFTKKQYEEFIQEKYEKEKDDSDYEGKTETDIKEKLRKKYYAEYAYNILRKEKNGYNLLDRTNLKLATYSIEPMDLYKDDTMFAVKIGKTSAKLCYAVTQSLTALKTLKAYKMDRNHEFPTIKTVVLWLILEGRAHIENNDGVPQIKDLNMLMLKNRLDEWKKEVRHLGLEPRIYINYKDWPKKKSKS